MNNPPSFHEIKKQASFFLREKIKTARLALTDVTPAQLYVDDRSLYYYYMCDVCATTLIHFRSFVWRLAEEATNANSVGPDARTLKMLSKAAFEVDDYWRIVGILHKRSVFFFFFFFPVILIDLNFVDWIWSCFLVFVFICFRLVKYDKRNWRESYKAVVLLEYLLTHGPESVAEEFQRDRDEIREMERFQYIDEKGWVFLFQLFFLYS